MPSQAITDWLKCLPSHEDLSDDEYLLGDESFATSLLPAVSLPRPAPPSKPLKRKHSLYSEHGRHTTGAQANIQLSSPPPSSASTTMDADVTPTPKRQRLATAPATDLSDRTPRASSRAVSHGTRSVNIGHSSRSHSTTSGSRSEVSSRSLSPKKQLVNLSLADDGLDVRALDIDTVPEAAAEILSILQDVQNGTGILPASRRDDILGSTAAVTAGGVLPSTRDLAWRWRHSFKAPEEPDTLPGRIPTRDEVSHIREMAMHCQTTDQDELGWNMEVHHLILSSIFRRPQSSRALTDCPLNFAPCTTTRVNPEFLPRHASGKMVDFCIYYDTNAHDGDEDDEQRLRQQQQQQQQHALRLLSREMPTLTVNHTDFNPMRLHPIMLSIETKKPGKEQERANLQMAVWLAAQWASLQRAVLISIRASRRENTSSDDIHHLGGGEITFGEPPSAQEQIDIANLAEARVRELPFIPGITVQGHKWSLVLSTREGERTVLWTDWEFGNTQSLQNAYKVVAGLREIAAWIRDVYLQWWRRNVLDGLLGTQGS
jgi:hypothetical protein